MMIELEIMRKLIIGLVAWNAVLSLCFGLYIYNQNQEELNNKICNLETIPPYEIIEEF